jgi:hypothetical protein
MILVLMCEIALNRISMSVVFPQNDEDMHTTHGGNLIGENIPETIQF